jgi:hypothetical protein
MPTRVFLRKGTCGINASVRADSVAATSDGAASRRKYGFKVHVRFCGYTHRQASFGHRATASIAVCRGVSDVAVTTNKGDDAAITGMRHKS